MGTILTIFAILGLYDLLSGGKVGTALNEASDDFEERRQRRDEIEHLTLSKLRAEREEAERVERNTFVAVTPQQLFRFHSN